MARLHLTDARAIVKRDRRTARRGAGFAARAAIDGHTRRAPALQSMKKPGTVAKKPLLLDSQTVRTMELADAQLRGVAGGASSAGPIICKCSSGQIG